MATAAQIRMVYATAREIGMTNDDLHAMVAGLTGCESIRALNIKQAIRVIDRLNALAGKTRDVPDRASQGQQRKILALASALEWKDPARLRGFLEKRAGVSDIRFLTARQAYRIIEALKAMQAGKRGERRGKEAEHGRLDE